MSALKTYPPSSGAHRTEWKAPWSRSLAAQKPYDGDSLVTRLPQSYSESKGGFDVASRILDRQAATKERRGDRRRSADDTTMEKVSFPIIHHFCSHTVIFLYLSICLFSCRMEKLMY